MNSTFRISLFVSVLAGVILAGVLLVSCKQDNVPYDTKHLDKFHQLTTKGEENDLIASDLSLFVDYSNCIANGKSAFYQKMVSPLTAATKHYWSI